MDIEVGSEHISLGFLLAKRAGVITATQFETRFPGVAWATVETGAERLAMEILRQLAQRKAAGEKPQLQTDTHAILLLLALHLEATSGRCSALKAERTWMGMGGSRAAFLSVRQQVVANARDELRSPPGASDATLPWSA